MLEQTFGYAIKIHNKQKKNTSPYILVSKVSLLEHFDKYTLMPKPVPQVIEVEEMI
jgi:hypothetical protein